MAELYRRRWTTENRFYEVAQTLNCGPATLAYPRAAPFAFCRALVTSNAVAIVEAPSRGAHPADEAAGMSSLYMAEEGRATFAGMVTVSPAAGWAVPGRPSAGAFADAPRRLAARVEPRRYREANPGPKEPPPPKARYRNGGHASTHRPLERQKRRR